MKTRDVGRTGLKVTELGFGGGAIGGLYASVAREQVMEARCKRLGTDRGNDSSYPWM